MKAVRDRAEARFHPARFHFALFRLMAWTRFRSASPREQKGLLLILDRDQTAWEHYLVASWYVATTSCLASALLSVNVAVAMIITIVFVSLLVCVIGVVVRNRNNIRLQSTIFMTLMLGAASYYTFADSWVRFASWQCLALAALNGFCAIVLFVMREAVPSAA